MDPIGPNGDAESGCLSAEVGWQGEPLDTARLRLRRLVPADAEAVAALLDDWNVVRTTSNIPFPYGRVDADGFIASVTQESVDGRVVVFAIEERLSNRLIGCVGATIASGTAEIGYWLGQAFWGRGYATEVVRRCLRVLFSNLAIQVVWATVLPENPASRRVLEKCGLSFDSRRRIDMPARGVNADMDAFTLDRQGWDRLRAERSTLLVAAVALVDVDGRVLLAQRPAGKSMAGFWEVPGGKVEAGETPEAALVRELAEELGIDVGQSCLAPLTFASHDYDSFHLLMPLYVCRQWRGQPHPKEGQTLAWVRPNRLFDYPLPPADVPLVAILRDWL